MNIHLDMYQTLAVAVLVLMLGSFLRKKIHFLEKFCIPAPVIGGLLFAIFTCPLRFSPVSVTVPELQNFPLMIPCGKYVWYSSLLP